MSNRSARYGIALCCAGMMSLAIGINLMPVFFTTIQATLGGDAGLSNEQLGRIGAVTFIGLVIAILVTGPMADRLGGKVFALVGNALVAIGLLILGLSSDYTVLLAASFVMGIGAGTLDMVLSPITGVLAPDNRSAAMNWLHSFYCTGAVLTAVIASVALKLGVSWQAVSLALVAMPLLVLGGFAGMHVPPLVDAAHEQGRQRLRDLLRIPGFWAALIAILLGGATEMGMAYWLPAYAEKSLGFSQFTGAMAFTGFLAAMAVGRIGTGLIGHTRNIRRIMIASCSASVVLFMVACFAPWPGVALAGCVLAGLSGSALWPSMLALTADRFPRGGASMYGALAAAGNFGGIIMPWIVGLAADRWNMSIGLATAAICPLLMGIILAASRR